jgi:TRAP-type C4-dicarboxylate transport system substrate-binding protein
MSRIFAIVLLALAAFVPVTAGAQPVTLKLAFFTSETEVNYAKAIKLWVDAVNADPSGAVKIRTARSARRCRRSRR